MVRLGGDVEFPEVHPEQVAALARRRDLPALLDRHVPLGPDQSAVRLGVRRTDFAHVVRLGWVAEVSRVWVDWGKANGGTVEVPLYSAREVALLPVVRPGVDWAALRRTVPGRRSLLAALTPAAPGQDVVSLDDVARIAGVKRAAVTSWRRTLPGAPPPAAGSRTRPLFDRSAVAAWLLTHGKITVPTTALES
ncbi:hypothetical protein ACFXD5_23765 [Streptomyces sp. NPDC059385]|uniref:hypothetical protein n=1 Tax=Streptomyces sp. NPDC059385 TaxID=3346817 RepID=UPI0036B03EED